MSINYDVRARQKLYRSYRWQKVSRAYLAQHPTCAYCGGHSDVVDHIHHGEGWQRRFFDPTNWAPACRSCNSRKAWQGQEAVDNGNATRHLLRNHQRRQGVLPGGYRARGGGCISKTPGGNVTRGSTENFLTPQTRMESLVEKLRSQKTVEE
jgi:hypothetical protein